MEHLCIARFKDGSKHFVDLENADDPVDAHAVLMRQEGVVAAVVLVPKTTIETSKNDESASPPNSVA